MPRRAFTVQSSSGTAEVTPDPDGWTYRIEARTYRSGRVVDVTVASAFRNESGFGGRQWETSLPGGGTVGEGQHPTLRAAAEETLDLSEHRATIAVFVREQGLLDGRIAPEASIPTPEQRPAEGRSDYEQGAADKAWAAENTADALALRGGEPLIADVLTHSPEWSAGYTGRKETPSMALDSDHQSIPDSEVWSEETGETFGEARARFATFGPEVPATMVPALVEAGITVWSFGYGDDPEDFTTIEDSDLAGTDWSDPADTGVWAPFRIDALTPDAERILAGVEPTVAPLTRPEYYPNGSPVAPYGSTDSLLRRTIVEAVAPTFGQDTLSYGEQADRILAALTREGFTISDPAGEERPDGHSWAERCAFCLEEPFDVEDVHGACPERA